MAVGDTMVNPAATKAPAGDYAGEGMNSALGGLGMIGGWITSAQNVHNMRQERRIAHRREDSAHQRAMADLEKAGLNPILAGHQGAQSSMGSAAQIHNSFEPLQTQLIKAQIADIHSARKLKDSQSALAGEERALKAGQGMALQPEIDTYQERKEAIREHLRQIKLLNSHSGYDLDRARRESEFHKGKGGAISPWLKNIMDKIPGLGGVIIDRTRKERR